MNNVKTEILYRQQMMTSNKDKNENIIRDKRKLLKYMLKFNKQFYKEKTSNSNTQMLCPNK